MKYNWLRWGIIAVAVLAVGVYFVWRNHWEHRYDRPIEIVATKYGLSPGLVKAVVWQESRFDASAKGRAGELGLMQVGEDAAREWAEAEGVSPYVHELCFDPMTNLLAGTFYLRKALSKYPAVDDPIPYALAEYNAGRGNVLKWRAGIAETNSEVFIQQIGFPSTSNYVRRIIANRARFEGHFKASGS